MSDITDEMVEAYRQAAIRCSASTYSAPYHDDCCPRAGLAAVYPLLRAQIAEEVAAEVLADAARHPANYCEWTTGEIVATIRDLAADGAEAEPIGGAA